MDSNFLAAEACFLDPDVVNCWAEDLLEDDCIKGDEGYDYFIDA